MGKTLVLALIGVVLGAGAVVVHADGSATPRIESCTTYSLEGAHKNRKAFKSAHKVGFKEVCVGGDGQLVERIERNDNPNMKVHSKRRVHKSAHSYADLP